MRSTLKFAAVGGAAALTLALSACGSNSSTTGSTATTAASAPAAVATPSSAPTPVAALTDLKGKMTQVTLDPKFLAGLTSLKLTPGLIGPAKLTGAVLTFPITGGSATYYTPGSRDPYVESSIKHAGSGLTLTDGKTKVGLSNFTVDAGKSMLYGDVTANGAAVATQAPLFFLDGRTLKPLAVDKSTNTAVLEGTTVSLTKTAADLLDKTYKVTALTEFFPVGVAKITLALG